MAAEHARFVYFHTDGVGLVIAVFEQSLPVILHWGAELGDITSVDAQQLLLACAANPGEGTVDTPRLVAVMPEHWAGWFGRPGISGSRQDGSAWTPKFSLSHVDVNESRMDGDFASFTTGSATIHATDRTADLELNLVIEMLVGGAVRMRATLTNLGARDYRLDELVLAYPVPARAVEIQDFAGHWGQEKITQRHEFTVGQYLREGRKGRTGADSAGVLHAGVQGFTTQSGEVWGVHTAWSGNHIHYAERAFTGEKLIGGGELILPNEIVLGSGESYTSPWVYGTYGIGLDQTAHRFHTYLRSRPQHPSTSRPVTLNVWEAVYFNQNLEELRCLADIAAQLGVERYVLDDGWFSSRRNDRSGLGDWYVSDEVWPQGLHPLVDHVHSLGMQFGLWFEPEMVNEDSAIARAHPEWIMAPEGRLPVRARHQQVLNIGIPECYEHIYSRITKLIDEYGIAYIKWDHNRDLIDAGTLPRHQPGVHAQTRATYRMMAQLKRDHPGLEIESCSSGGGRIDLGIMEYADRVWVSDNIDPVDRQQMLRGTSQLLPLEMLGSHIASRTSESTGRTHDLDFRAATALFGHLGIEWDLRKASPQERETLAQWITFYKQIREFLFTGDYVRLDFPDHTLLGCGVIDHAKRKALYSLASMDVPITVSRGMVTLPGLDASTHYHVTPHPLTSNAAGLRPPLWFNDGKGFTATGAMLEHVGLHDISLFPEHATLICVEAVES
ncbi:MAG: alpha-galactosidase [Actinomycetaceae bacterium]|nr:alpha-galactosidase [Actinomycetaceae bacterium]MDY6082503.1 alpha-galactosidase [Actinomycetaceae bacterium]